MDAFEAIAEPNRRRILDLLRDGERPAGEVVEALAISQPGVSKHLRLLREAGWSAPAPTASAGSTAWRPAELATVESWLAPYRDFWRGRLDALEAHLERDQ